MTPAMTQYLAMLAADVASVTPYSYAEAYEALLRGNQILADAWDEGYRNGYSIGGWDSPTARTNYENPYREVAS